MQTVIVRPYNKHRLQSERPKTKQPNWQDATAATITRIQQIFALHPAKRDAQGFSGLSDHSKVLLYAQAAAIVQSQGRTGNATEYWNTFVNTLRTLVAGMSSCDPADTFDR